MLGKGLEILDKLQEIFFRQPIEYKIDFNLHFFHISQYVFIVK